MMKSLLLKLGMLAVTVGIVLWVAWIRQPPGVSTERQTTASVNRSAHQGQEQSLEPTASAKGSPQGEHRLLDLNRANADELESLPGIGAVLAQRVLAFRESVGRFRKIDELRAVKGIGAKKFNRLKSLVTVSAENTTRETERRES